jgi:hypothetical protein
MGHETDWTLVSTLLTGDPSIREAKPQGLGLQMMEHTQFFSERAGVGGNYHGDSSPGTITYKGYFIQNSEVYKLDFHDAHGAAGHNWRAGVQREAVAEVEHAVGSVNYKSGGGLSVPGAIKTTAGMHAEL